MGCESPKKPSGEPGPSDVLLVYGSSDDGKRFDVLRQRGAEIQAGTIRPLDEGKPIHGEVVRLAPRRDSPLLFDVEVEHEAPRSSAGRPAQVATEDYRRGWESIWAKKRSVRALN
jgi:hypothetical protein